MKRKFALTIALCLSVTLLSLMTSDASVQAQGGNRRAVFDTGVVTLGPNQILRVTAAGTGEGSNARIRFRQVSYAQESCGNGVCRALVTNEVIKETTFDFLRQAVWFDIGYPNNAAGVRGIVSANDPRVKVTVLIIDTATGQISSIDIPPIDINLLG